MVRTLRRVLVGVALLLLALLGAVAVNQEPVSLQFLIWRTPQWSVFWWLFIAFVVGGVLGHVLALLSTVPIRLERRRLQKQLAAAGLNTTPVKSGPSGTPSSTSAPLTPNPAG